MLWEPRPRRAATAAAPAPASTTTPATGHSHPGISPSGPAPADAASPECRVASCGAARAVASSRPGGSAIWDDTHIGYLVSVRCGGTSSGFSSGHWVGLVASILVTLTTPKP